jgi:hypothetical protein
LRLYPVVRLGMGGGVGGGVGGAMGAGGGADDWVLRVGAGDRVVEGAGEL